jgi:5'-phosphate synthase pdxT subunit
MPSQQSQATLTIGVLALQGAFVEHIALLQRAATSLALAQQQEQNASLHPTETPLPLLHFIEVRTPAELASCTALVLPGGESTAISLIAERCGLLEPLRAFVKVQRKPVWGTCAGLILLAESANKSKATGQELIGGLDVRVQRNYFGRQVESFEADLRLSFLEGQEPFHSVFIRAPVVEKVLSASELVAEGGETVARKTTKPEVEILCRLPGRAKTLRDKTTTAEDLGEDGDIVAVRQGNVFGTAFHPELTGDERIHAWWLGQVIEASREQAL